MKLDEAIITYENNAEFERKNGNLLGWMYFKQLATWLRQLRKYKIEFGDIEIKEEKEK